ncbi:MAG: hypothetical protein LBK82_02790, partial [Planctomycetaceae bacterium]|nr:hypothetical protein [Planctomycetaceae bacterium]
NINGINYFIINSASYQWHDTKISAERYPLEFRNKAPFPSGLEHMSFYKDPLYCFVTINSAGEFLLKGVKSEWVVPPPPNPTSPSVRFGRMDSPSISDYKIVLKNS